LTSDNKRAPHEVDSDLDDESHAADEPTAVWDESALRAAGLSDLLQKRDSEPPAPAATAPMRSADASIVVDQASIVAPANKTPTPVPDRPAAPASADGGLGWGATFVIAVVLGALMYALIRYVKG